MAPAAPRRADLPDLFDVDDFRSRGRTIVVREVERRVVVLGSTQARGVADEVRASRAGVRVARRRSGGGAVLLLPGGQVWIDVWVPRGDPMWSDDPRRLAGAVGEWWASALATGLASTTLTVHGGGSVPAVGSDLVCFGGVGPGEVIVGGRKLVGLAQWRSREGALVHGCAYRRWEAEPLVELLDLDGATRETLLRHLRVAAVGLDAAGAPSSWGAEALLAVAPSGGRWDVRAAVSAPTD